MRTRAVTDSDGRFRFPLLSVGPYELVIAKQGYRSLSRSLSLNAGSAFQMPIALAVGGEETVTVTDEAPALETARSQIAGTVTSAEAIALPLNGRNFLDIALLVPGVSPTNVPSTQLFAETSAVPGHGLSVASQRNLSNSFIIDGVSANDDAAGLSGIPLSVERWSSFRSSPRAARPNSAARSAATSTSSPAWERTTFTGASTNISATTR